MLWYSLDIFNQFVKDPDIPMTKMVADGKKVVYYYAGGSISELVNDYLLEHNQINWEKAPKT